MDISSVVEVDDELEGDNVNIRRFKVNVGDVVVELDDESQLDVGVESNGSFLVVLEDVIDVNIGDVANFGEFVLSSSSKIVDPAIDDNIFPGVDGFDDSFVVVLDVSDIAFDLVTLFTIISFDPGVDEFVVDFPALNPGVFGNNDDVDGS